MVRPELMRCRKPRRTPSASSSQRSPHGLHGGGPDDPSCRQDGATRRAGNVTPATLTLCEDFAQVRTLGPMRAKGLSAPIEVYELAGTNPKRSRFQAHAARVTKFVGRVSELTQLGEALELARVGRGQGSRSLANPASASRGCFGSSPTRIAPMTGWCLRRPACPTVRRRLTAQ